MNGYDFYMTADGSVGLYSESAGDILHSRTGALKEAYDKFINPVIDLINNFDDLKVLDLCSGVGYNLKAVLSCLKSKNTEIFSVDINQDLIFLSLFLSDSINDVNLKLYLLSQIIENGFSLSDIYNSISQIDLNKNMQFFCPDMINFIKFLNNGGYNSCGEPLNYRFVHNIYYNYISSNIKYDLECNKYNNIKINYIIDDARKILKSLDGQFNLVFLDAYSPQKDPTLWTYDFLNLLKSKMNDNSILVSYSKSIPFRSALVELGFNVGKTFLDNIDMGTVASFDKKYISSPLDETDIKLISTNSGIFFRDIDLSSDSESIILNRQSELINSDRLSRTQFDKYYR